MYTEDLIEKTLYFLWSIKTESVKSILQLSSGVLYIFLDIYGLWYLIWQSRFKNDEMCFFIWLHKLSAPFLYF